MQSEKEIDVRGELMKKQQRVVRPGTGKIVQRKVRVSEKPLKD